MADDSSNTSWLKDPKLLQGVVKREEANHASRQAEVKTYLRCYWDRPVISADYTRPYRELAVFDTLKESFGGNLTREVVDAAVSQLCRPLVPKLEPKSNEFGLAMGCKQAQRLIEGVFDNSNFLGLAKQAIRDGATADVGPTKGLIDPWSNEIKFERVNPLSLYWVENGTDRPRTFMQIEAVSRDELADRYPRFAKKIRDMKTWSAPTIIGVDLPGTRRRNEDTVKFVEAWAVKRGSKPGRHVLMVSDLVLEDESWEYPIPPIFSFRWSSEFRSYAGVSLARIVNPYDNANRRLLRMVYASLAGAMPQLLKHVDTDTEGPSDQEFGSWEWDGTVKPEIIVSKVVNSDILTELDRNRTRAYAEGGVNQGMATGQAPARYTSGAAQREYVDIANTRLLDAQQQTELYWKDGTEVTIMLAAQAKKTHVKVKGANYYEGVSYPKLPRDSFKVSVGLASGLSLTPSARKQDLVDLKDMGLIDSGDLARGLALPDIEAQADRLNAPRDLIMKQISVCLDSGPSVPFPMPSAMMDLNTAVRVGQEEWQRAVLQGNYPAENVEMLRRWIMACRSRLAPPPLAPVAAGAPLPVQPLPVAPPAPGPGGAPVPPALAAVPSAA